MFNWSLKLRKQSEFCIPQGPSFNRAEKINFEVDGTEISFCAPRHSSHFSSKEVIQPRKENRYDHLMMRPYKSYDRRWLYNALLRRSWGFYGAWLTGYMGELSMRVALVTPGELNQGISFFRPKAFENALADYLQYQYADDIHEGAQKWLAPLDWQVVNSCATFYVRANVGNIAAPDRYFLFPISDKHFIEVYFNLHRAGAGSQEEKDKHISLSTIEQLSTDIINSIQIKLSPEALAQQAKALEGLEDTQLSEHFPPMKFTTPEQDAEYENYLKDELRTQEILNS
ncbi:MAG: hypothetical protein ACI9T9_003093 [Oleiphilaceae bacterium]|jgi:hypothetical protein